MAALSPFLAIDSTCDQAFELTKTKLSQAGLRAVQTFNLNTARLGLHNCACSHHGTEECDCQMMVLLVYGESAEPATLILHGNDGRTWVSVTDDALHPTPQKLTTSIRLALESLAVVDL